MTVREIVAEYLRANGYDGLWSPNHWCACLLGDLMPCEDDGNECEPGYRVDCPRDCPEGPCGFHVQQERAAITVTQYDADGKPVSVHRVEHKP